MLKYFILKYMPKDEKGQDLAEYALLIGLIAIIVIGAVTILGGEINNTFQLISGAFVPK